MKDELLTGSRLTFKAVTLVVASLLPMQNSWAQTYTSGQHVEPALVRITISNQGMLIVDNQLISYLDAIDLLLKSLYLQIGVIANWFGL